MKFCGCHGMGGGEGRRRVCVVGELFGLVWLLSSVWQNPSRLKSAPSRSFPDRLTDAEFPAGSLEFGRRLLSDWGDVGLSVF
jgi:hypothetical protein